MFLPFADEETSKRSRQRHKSKQKAKLFRTSLVDSFLFSILMSQGQDLASEEEDSMGEFEVARGCVPTQGNCMGA